MSTFGDITINQDVPGTTNGVKLNAGTDIVGKVGIDQTTSGTTNAVTLVDKNTGAAASVNSSGQVHTVMKAKVDTLNSSETPLLGGIAFTGSAVETLDYSEISIAVYSDVDSATNGLSLDFSSDGLTWVPGSATMSIYATLPKTFSFQPERRYYRVVYTNGANPQTVFNLETILRKTRAKPSSHSIQDAIVADDDAELIKSVITGERDDGIFSNATLSNSNRLRVVAQPYEFAVAEGDLTGHLPVRRFGHNPSVGTAIETIDGTSDLYVYLTSAEILKVVSTSAQDAAGGTGATGVFIQGLDTNYVLQSEVVIPTGAVAAATTKSYLRVLAFYDYSVGTGGANAGTITLTNNAGTNTLAQMDIGEGRASAAIFTVPAGYTFYMTSLYGSENSSKGTDITLWKRDFGDGGWQLIRLYTVLDSVFEHVISVPLVFDEKADISMRVKCTLAGGNVAGGFFGWMEA